MLNRIPDMAFLHFTLVTTEKTKTGAEICSFPSRLLTAIFLVHCHKMPEILMEIEEANVLFLNRRALITGATGLLGHAVYREFKDNNWHVVGC